MNERYLKILKRVDDNTMVVGYIKQKKIHWWNKWEDVMNGEEPLFFDTLPYGKKACKKMPSLKYLLATDKLRLSLAGIISPPHPILKGDREIRESMIDMVRNADEIYVGIIQDGKYYVATDTSSIQSCRDLQTLESDD